MSGEKDVKLRPLTRGDSFFVRRSSEDYLGSLTRRISFRAKKDLVNQPVEAKSLSSGRISVHPVVTEQNFEEEEKITEKQDAAHVKVYQKVSRFFKRTAAAFTCFDTPCKVYIEETAENIVSIDVVNSRKTIHATDSSSGVSSGSHWTEEELSLAGDLFFKQFEGDYEELDPEEKIQILQNGLDKLRSDFDKLLKHKKSKGLENKDHAKLKRMKVKAHVLYEQIEQLPFECDAQRGILLEEANKIERRCFPSQFLDVVGSDYNLKTPEVKVGLLKYCLDQLAQESRRLKAEKASEFAFLHIEEEIDFLKSKMGSISSLSPALRQEMEEAFECVEVARFDSRFQALLSTEYERKGDDEKIKVLDRCFLWLQRELQDLRQEHFVGAHLEVEIAGIKKEIAFLTKKVEKIPVLREEVVKKEKKIEITGKNIKKLQAQGIPTNYLTREIHKCKLAIFRYQFASETQELLKWLSSPRSSAFQGRVEDVVGPLEQDILEQRMELSTKKDPFYGKTEAELTSKLAALKEGLAQILHIKTKSPRGDVMPLLAGKIEEYQTLERQTKEAVIRFLKELPQAEKNRIVEELPNPALRPV